MRPFELPIIINTTRDGFTIAVAISETTVVSRQISRSDLSQLHVRIGTILGKHEPPLDD